MAYDLTPWEFSDVTDEEVSTFEQMAAGWRHVKICDAGCDENGKYFLKLEDLQAPGVTAYVSYNLYKSGENGEMVRNAWSLSTLRSLGKALFNMDRGIPNPADIVGGVCLAEVRHKTSQATGRTYVNIYQYKPDIEDFVALGSLMDQFYLPNEAGEE